MSKPKNKNAGLSKGKPWREFEKLISQIEEALCPKGAIVKSPDYISDLNTGTLREVDASIRFEVGSAPILITIECRDRWRASKSVGHLIV